MGFSWVTFLAQIVNLFILVWLLKKFLYQPVLNAVEKRQREIQARIDNARSAEKSAEDLRKTLDAERQAFADKKDVLFQQAIQEVADEKAILITKMAEEIRDLKNKAQNTLNARVDTESRFARDFMVQSFSELSIQIIKQMCDTDLKDKTITVFIKHLNKLPISEKKRLKSLIKMGKSLEITTAQPISKNGQKDLKIAILTSLNLPIETAVVFKINPDFIAGAEIRLDDIQIDWHLKSYVDTFEQTLKNNLSTLIQH